MVIVLCSLKAGGKCVVYSPLDGDTFQLDPLFVQEGIESQAIDRVNRIGQKNPVHVFQMIADGTVESKVMEIQARKKKLINQVRNLHLYSTFERVTIRVQQAFSGMKTRENERQKKEARIQGKA